MSRTAVLEYQLRDFYWEHPSLQYLYSAAATSGAWTLNLVGHRYGAMLQYCSAARRVRPNWLREARLRSFTRFLGDFTNGAAPRTLADNPFAQQFLHTAEAAQHRAHLRTLSREERLSMRGNLIVLKNPGLNERGVLLLQYTHVFGRFLVNYDVRKLSQRFSIVLEPSWLPYPDPYWAMFSCRETPVVSELMNEAAAEALHRSELPLIPLSLGAQDWINPDDFRPMPGVKKDYDLVMIASFAPFKRHYVVFEAMRRLRPRRLRLALVGGTWQRTRAEMDAEIRSYGLQDDVDVYQGLSAAQINDLLNRSKYNVLFSKVEGGNRALMEGFAAGTPCIVYKHIFGPRHADINEHTGYLADDHELVSLLPQALEQYEKFRAREWFVEHTGCYNATRKLNAVLQEEAQRRSENWTSDIVCKVNRNDLVYRDPSDAARMKPGWDELQEALTTL